MLTLPLPPSLIRAVAERDSRAIENRRANQGTVTAIDPLAHTSRVDIGAYLCDGTKVYFEDVPHDPHVVPSAGDTVSLDYAHTRTQSVRIVGTNVANSNGQGTITLYTAVQKDGTLVGSENFVNFQTGANAVLTVTDDPTNKRVNVKIDATSEAVDNNGTLVGSQPTLNFIPSGPLTWTIVNNSGASRIDITIGFANQSANTVLAGPTSGGAAAPTFRTLVVGDLPASATNGQVLRTISGAAAWDDDTKQITIVFPANIAVGQYVDLPIEYACTIQSWRLLSTDGTSGSLSIDIRKCTYAQYDGGTTHPVSGDSIVASAAPSITTAVKNTSSTLTGWTTTVNAGDVLRFYVSSVTSIVQAVLTLKVRR